VTTAPDRNPEARSRVLSAPRGEPYALPDGFAAAPIVVEYECPDCKRLWPSAAVRDGCCTWDEE